jgi:teichuronic acid biosynthesis glycosyltransferase TuaC
MPPSSLTWERRDPESEVLIVVNTWPNEDNPAYGIFVKRQVESLVRARLRCDVLYLRGYRSPTAYPLAAAWFASRSRSIATRYKLVHAHAGETALAARCQIGAPIIASYQGDDLLGSPAPDGSLTRQGRIRASVVRHHARLLDATVTKSTEMAEALPRAARARNHVIPNGVDTETFKPIPRGDARNRLDWGDDELVALFCATKPHAPSKRRWLAEAACADAARRLGRPVTLKVADKVEPQRVPLLMNAADCLLVTSSIEGSPNTVKEALMCNLPVIATPAGDIPSLLESVSRSRVCEPDEAVLGGALAECLATRERSNGRDASGWLADDAIARRLLALYANFGVHGFAVPGARASAVADASAGNR